MNYFQIDDVNCNYLYFMKKRIEEIYQKKVIIEYIQYKGTENWEPNEFMNRSRVGEYFKHELEVVINNLNSAISFATQESMDFDSKIKGSLLNNNNHYNQQIFEQDITNDDKQEFQSFTKDNEQNFENYDEQDNQSILKQLNQEHPRYENHYPQQIYQDKENAHAHQRLQDNKGMDLTYSFKKSNDRNQNNINFETNHSQDFQQFNNDSRFQSSNQQNGNQYQNSLTNIQNPMMGSMLYSDSDYNTGNFATMGVKADNFQEMISSSKQQHIKDKLQHAQNKRNSQDEENNKFDSKKNQQKSQISISQGQQRGYQTQQGDRSHQLPPQSHSQKQIVDVSRSQKNIKSNSQLYEHNNEKSQNSSINDGYNNTNSNKFTTFAPHQSNSQKVIQHEQEYPKATQVNSNTSKDINGFDKEAITMRLLKLQQEQQLKDQQGSQSLIGSKNLSRSEHSAPDNNQENQGDNDESANKIMAFELIHDSEDSSLRFSDNLEDIQNDIQAHIRKSQQLEEHFNIQNNKSSMPYISQSEFNQKGNFSMNNIQQGQTRQSQQNLNNINNTSQSFDYYSLQGLGSFTGFKDQLANDTQNQNNTNSDQGSSQRIPSKIISPNLHLNIKQNDKYQVSVIGEEKESGNNTRKRASLVSGQSSVPQNNLIIQQQQMDFPSPEKQENPHSNGIQLAQNTSIQSPLKGYRITLGPEGMAQYGDFNTDQDNDASENQNEQYPILNMIEKYKKNNVETPSHIQSAQKLDTPHRNSILEIQQHIHKRQISEQSELFDTDSSKVGYWKEKFEKVASKEKQYKKNIEEQKQTLQVIKSDINKLEFLHRMQKSSSHTSTDTLTGAEARIQTWHLVILAFASVLFGYMLKRMTL